MGNAAPYNLNVVVLLGSRYFLIIIIAIFIRFCKPCFLTLVAPVIAIKPGQSLQPDDFWSVIFGVLGFWGFGVLGFWGFGVLGFWGIGSYS